jgi:hypothetical protein
MFLIEGIIDKINRILNKKPLTLDTGTEIRGITSFEMYKKMARERIANSFNDEDEVTSFSSYDSMLKAPANRKKLYSELEKMDLKSGLISSCLDMYADNATQSEDGEIVKFASMNKAILKPIEKMKAGLNLNKEMYSILRTAIHLGDDFEEIVLDEDLNFRRLKNITGSQMERREDIFGKTLEFIQTANNGSKVNFKPWEIVHFRNKKYRNYKYGVSYLLPVMDDYKRFEMMKDGLVIHRLSRSPLRYVYYVDTEGLNMDDRLEYLKLVKQMTKKRRVTDPASGKMNLNSNPLSMDEDIHLAVTKDSKSDVKVLQGYGQVYMADILFVLDCVLAGLKIPKSHTPFGSDNQKSVLTEQDVQYARNVRRCQYIGVDGVREMADFSLTLAGMNTDRIEDNIKNGYKVIFPKLNTVDELRKWQVEQLKAGVGQTLKASTNIPNYWIYSEIMEYSEEKIKRITALEEEEYNASQERYAKELEKEKEYSMTSSNADVRLPNNDKKFPVEPSSIEGIISGGRQKELKRLKQNPKFKESIKDLNMLINWSLDEEPTKEEVGE